MTLKDIHANRRELRKVLRDLEITPKSKKHIVDSIINMKRGKVFKCDMSGLEKLK